MGEWFADFFQKATGHSPYPYQSYVAESVPGNSIWQIPTGLGKTAAAVLAWAWQWQTNPKGTPRRLVYCLPMRVLVEQVAAEVTAWFRRLGVDTQIPVHILMGGADEPEWWKFPNRPALLVGTQDMLLSRALNRGYGMSRYVWPAAFGLLNSDCRWVFDETQLFGAGLPTSAQLASLRESFGCIGACESIWMSATPDVTGLKTVDFERHAAGLPLVHLTDSDLLDPNVDRRLRAVKRLNPAPRECRTPAGLASFVIREHAPGTQSLVVVNRVTRAREVFAALKAAGAEPELMLLHSRFRGCERQSWNAALKAGPGPSGRIIVSTQVIEAGVDITSALLATDLAPLSSMFQRFGRANRDGLIEAARVFWVDRPVTAKESKLADAGELDDKQARSIAQPYEAVDLARAAACLSELASASPADLPPAAPPRASVDVLRRRDVVDLFDTTRDLAGFDVDISRFVRGGDEHDLLAAWRELDDTPPRDYLAPTRDELCPIPIGEMRAFLTTKGSKHRGWYWDAFAGRWQLISSEQLRPGLVLLLPAAAGGYSPEYGWDPGSTSLVPQAQVTGAREESLNEDPLADQPYRQSLDAHARETRKAMERLMDELGNLALDEYRPALLIAASGHDDGKTHPVFQRTLHGKADYDVLLAKATGTGRHERPFFRHELASALAVLARGAPDLAAYLAAAHHGKVRLSIRAMPGEKPPEDPGARFARGVHDGDLLPPVRQDGTTAVVLDLTPMVLGGGSWVERMTRLRDCLGPFRLAYLEALVRAADIAASSAPEEVLP